MQTEQPQAGQVITPFSQSMPVCVCPTNPQIATGLFDLYRWQTSSLYLLPASSSFSHKTAGASVSSISILFFFMTPSAHRSCTV